MQKIAIAQESPILLDRQATLAKAVALVEQAAAEGAQLIVFPETFLCGYPAWIWRLRPGNDWGTNEALHQRLLASSIDIAAGQLAPLYEAAKTHKIYIVCGLNERDARHSGTLYNSVVIINDEGQLLNRHRKLMPTNPERMVWGCGDGAGLRVVDSPVGRIGSLICWENYMPLARFALYAQGLEVYIAPTYDSGEGWLGTMQHIAREGRCWVISAGVALERCDLPEDFPDKDTLYPAEQEWINPGDSVVIAPGGDIVAGPLHEEKGLLYAEIDANRVALAKRALDVAGHYARPDILSLHINGQEQSSIKFD